MPPQMSTTVLAGSNMPVYCDKRSNLSTQNTAKMEIFFQSRISQYSDMKVIDQKWLQDRLTGERGEQARLARHLGITTDKVAKIVMGKRRVQAAEVPKLLTFFGEDPPDGLEELHAIALELDKVRGAQLLQYAHFLRSQTTDEQPSEASDDDLAAAQDTN